MSRFRIVALVALIGWGSALVGLSAQGAAPAAAGDQQARGKALYLDKCSACHQDALQGTAETPTLTGDPFWMNWETYSANNLVVQIKATMPEDNPGGLELPQYVDIVAYMLKFNGVPRTGDLPTDADGLKKVVIQKKP